jgi:hypothetical protein
MHRHEMPHLTALDPLGLPQMLGSRARCVMDLNKWRQARGPQPGLSSADPFN